MQFLHMFYGYPQEAIPYHKTVLSFPHGIIRVPGFYNPSVVSFWVCPGFCRGGTIPYPENTMLGALGIICKAVQFEAWTLGLCVVCNDNVVQGIQDTGP